MDDENEDGKIDVTELRFDLLEMAIDYHTKQGDNKTPAEIVNTAKVFENYLIMEPPLEQKDDNDQSNERNGRLLS